MNLRKSILAKKNIKKTQMKKMFSGKTRISNMLLLLFMLPVLFDNVMAEMAIYQAIYFMVLYKTNVS